MLLFSMKITRIFCAADQRVCFLRAVLLGATLLGMLCCIPLWLTTREYPIVPVFSWWPVLPRYPSLALFCSTLSSLAIAAWFFRPAVGFFLAAIFYLFCCDQNREQPWMYIYWVMLLLNLLPERIALAGCRLVLSFVYLWAGIQKMNGVFESVVPEWFVQPAKDWGLPGLVIAGLRLAVALTPLFEVFIAVGVWFAQTRWPAILIAILLHGASLLFLGPFGHDVNFVIWPWNISMVGLIFVLFASRDDVSLLKVLRDLCESIPAILMVGLFGMLPILSFFGHWDSYLSFSLYSYNLAKAEVYISRPMAARLPVSLRTYVYPVKNRNSALQLPFMFEHSMWAEADMGVPPLPEQRGYVVMFQHLSAYAASKNDCFMLVRTRQGRLLFYFPNDPKPVVFGK